MTSWRDIPAPLSPLHPQGGPQVRPCTTGLSDWLALEGLSQWEGGRMEPQVPLLRILPDSARPP